MGNMETVKHGHMTEQLVKNTDFGAWQTWVLILALPLGDYPTLNT